MKETLRQEIEEWVKAVRLMVRFEGGQQHLDTLLDQSERLQMRWLVVQAFRDWHTINGIMEPRLKRSPRPVTKNLLRLALAECLSGEAEERPRIVHHAVEVGRALKLSKSECGFVNAVLRSILREGSLDTVLLQSSHPEWLRRRWEKQFSAKDTIQLMTWNQAIPELHVTAESVPEYAEESEWPGYFKVRRSRFREVIADLEAGAVYVQDPFARIPVDLLNPSPGESVMDICASPGGKSRLISSRLQKEGRLVLVDRPGVRLERLRENAVHFPTAPEIIGCPVESLPETAHEHSLELASMDAVLIDVPCNNTGVIQKRPDVKIRLSEEDIAKQPTTQLMLLKEAARWVRPGGRLVYSTCSLEREENEEVVDAFCREMPQFKLEKSILSRPWECGHDGGGAFLLTMGDGQ